MTLMLVGDPDQMMYSFAGASPELITERKGRGKFIVASLPPEKASP